MNENLIIAQVLTDFETIDDEGVSFGEKWEFIRNWLGNKKEINIMYDFSSDDFLDAYLGDDPTILTVFLFLAQIRYQIFSELINYSGRGDTKMLEIGMESSAVWAQKIYDKALAVDNNTEVSHTWLN